MSRQSKMDMIRLIESSTVNATEVLDKFDLI
jgi:hypothetical protein